MKKMTIEQTRKEILKIRKEVAEISRRVELTNQENFRNNKAAYDEVNRLWGQDVRPAADRTSPSKSDINSAYEMAQKLLKVMKILSAGK